MAGEITRYNITEYLDRDRYSFITRGVCRTRVFRLPSREDIDKAICAEALKNERRVLRYQAQLKAAAAWKPRLKRKAQPRRVRMRMLRAKTTEYIRALRASRAEYNQKIRSLTHLV